MITRYYRWAAFHKEGDGEAAEGVTMQGVISVKSWFTRPDAALKALQGHLNEQDIFNYLITTFERIY